MAEAGPSQEMGAVAVAVQCPDTCRGVYPCKSSGCNCCKHIQKDTDQFQSTATKEIYEIKEKLTCKTPSVIYIIQCQKCSMQYVGKTSTTVQRRFRDHRFSIKRHQHRPIPDHFSHNEHSLEDLIIFPIQQVFGSKALKERELYWITELQTITHGLNLVPYECGKHCGDGPPTPKKRGLKNKMQSCFSHETEEVLSACEDALQDGKYAISQVYTKLAEVSYVKSPFLEDLREKISGLKEHNPKKKIYIGLFGKTGAGKSSLINAIVNENQLLPSTSLQACTSVFVHVQANTESSKYKADIEFINKEDWESELRFLLELLSDSNENDGQQMANHKAVDDDLEKMAREKITAIYGTDGPEKSYSELVGTKRFLEIPDRGLKTLTFDTAKELSESIGCYIRSDKKNEVQYWPLVNRVTISLPRSPALLEGIVLVDIPGAGDANKQRDEMWKECLSQCSSVWIVSEMNRALSEKVADEIFEKTLRHVAAGGECHNITFICTKTDNVNPEEIKRNYNLTDEKLEIESESEDPQGYERKEKQACILFQNDRAKDEINKLFKVKAKKLLLGDDEHSDGFFDVYTVSSNEFQNIARGKSFVLDSKETELPLLMEHIKKLYVSHSKKEMKDYVSEVSGIISYLRFSKNTHSEKVQASNENEFNRLQKELDNTYKKLNECLSKVQRALQENLSKAAKTAERDCLENATKNVLEPTWKDNRGHHKTLKALCKNNGYYRSCNGEVVDLNYTLSEPMYKTMNEKNVFLTTFGSGGSRASIKGHFESFQENFITNDNLKSHSKESEKYLRLVYIRTEQRKLQKNLEKEILHRKKLIYNSLSDSIRDTMMLAYQECAGICGTSAFTEIQNKLKDKIQSSKNGMFKKAMDKMLTQFCDLQEYLEKEIKKEMKMSLSVALNQIPDDITGFPDVTEEIEMMKRCCDSLGLQVF